MVWSDKVRETDRRYPEDEENLHWPADEVDEEEEEMSLADDADPDAMLLDPPDDEEEELHWAIEQEEADDWG
jgi:hypothetical protein